MTETNRSALTYRIGVDVGGTFTDVVALRSDGVVVLEKTPTTPSDQSDGVLEGIGRIAAAEGHASTDAVLALTTSVVHGTTTGDNTMIQMSGASTGLLVTAGFRDEIEMRRCYKEDIWDPALGPPEPIAKRRVRLEISERLTAEGEIDTPLDEDEVRRAVRRLQAFGVTSIAIVFLHSYLNPVHELRARELVLEEYPEVELISLSHEVYPKPPEFERTSTTLVNAYVGPPIVRYLGRLEQRLRDAGYGGELLIATSAGGVATPDAIGRLAVATIGSGPTGGVVAASRASVDADLGDVVSVDMGGTSYDVCLIRGGSPELNSDWNWRHRYCIALPMVDIHAIGAGGGSIVQSDGVALQVGPESAGSEPGPACYGRGGTAATITDANLILGRLDPDTFWSGRTRLDATKAQAALEAAGRPLGLDAEAAAIAAIRIVDAHMTDAAASSPPTISWTSAAGSSRTGASSMSNSWMLSRASSRRTLVSSSIAPMPSTTRAHSHRVRPSSVPLSSSIRSRRCSCAPATRQPCVRTATCSWQSVEHDCGVRAQSTAHRGHEDARRGRGARPVRGPRLRGHDRRADLRGR